MGRWYDGVMECWEGGVMECWEGRQMGVLCALLSAAPRPGSPTTSQCQKSWTCLSASPSYGGAGRSLATAVERCARCGQMGAVLCVGSPQHHADPVSMQ